MTANVPANIRMVSGGNTRGAAMWQTLEEWDADGGLYASYVYGNYIDEVLSMRKDIDGAGTNDEVEDFYFHQDDLFNVVLVTDDAGDTAERYEYGDYGAPFYFTGGGSSTPSSAINNTRLFNGREWDEESRFYYYRTRYLEPTMGRFTTRDTIGVWGDAGNVGGSTTFVASNALARLDPYGRAAAGSASGTTIGTVQRAAGRLVLKGSITATLIVTIDVDADVRGGENFGGFEGTLSHEIGIVMQATWTPNVKGGPGECENVRNRCTSYQWEQQARNGAEPMTPDGFEGPDGLLTPGLTRGFAQYNQEPATRMPAPASMADYPSFGSRWAGWNVTMSSFDAYSILVCTGGPEKGVIYAAIVWGFSNATTRDVVNWYAIAAVH